MTKTIFVPRGICLLYSSRHRQRDDFLRSRSTQYLGATVQRRAGGEHVVQQDEAFAGEGGRVADGECAVHISRAGFGVEFGLGRGVFHPAHISFQRGNLERAAKPVGEVFGLVELALTQFARMQRHGNDGVDFAPVDPLLRGAQQPIHQMRAEIHLAIVFEAQDTVARDAFGPAGADGPAEIEAQILAITAHERVVRDRARERRGALSAKRRFNELGGRQTGEADDAGFGVGERTGAERAVARPDQV